MELIFGLHADGRTFPDVYDGAVAAIDRDVVGPAGLVSALEVALGLGGPQTAQAVRIAAWMAKMSTAVADNPDLFFASSFAKDPWATARSLLEWRDAWIMAGWDRSQSGSARVDAIAVVEAAGASLSFALADRLRNVTEVVKISKPGRLRTIRLIEPLQLMPPQWRKLFQALSSAGVTVHEAPSAGCAVSGSDLEKVRLYLANGASSSLSGDGTFVILEADTGLMSAETVAEWVAADSDRGTDLVLVLDTDGDTSLLDHALAARGLPALGQSASSPWRGALQVLPLAFALAWKPFRPQVLLDLLLLERSPVGRKAARLLAGALSREPGQGGSAWTLAWDRIEADLRERFTDADDGERQVRQRLERWRNWTRSGDYDRNAGMPVGEVRKIAARVSEWALTSSGALPDPLMLAAAGAAKAVMQAVDALELDIVPALLIERIVQQVAGDGAANARHIAHAGGLRCVGRAGAIHGSVKSLVWWNFCGPGEKAPTCPWSDAELKSLLASGCQFEDRETAAARRAWQMSHPLQMATERVILVQPRLNAGSASVTHPLLHQLDPLVRPARSVLTHAGEALISNAITQIGGRPIARQLVTSAIPPRARALWTLPVAARSRLAGREESATSLQRLIDCQTRWMLEDVLRLRNGRHAQIPSVDQLLGNLAHALAEYVFTPGSAPDASAVRHRVEAAFDAHVDRIAAPLRQPEYAADLADARRRVPEALADLASQMQAQGLSIIGSEVERRLSVSPGMDVMGRFDLLARRDNGQTIVLDLKWSRSERRRREEVGEGRALQLAAYSAMARSEGEPEAVGGFYLLAQRRMIAPVEAGLSDDPVNASRSLGETWNAVTDSWRTWRQRALDGTIVANGAPDADVHVPEDLAFPGEENPCAWCGLTALCRIGTVEA